ncbi:MAG TPA: DinB family protein [Bryobacteraceae bacterium]|nr:DinB family protein [Bryobacteraceae bacterium]
MPTDAVEPWLRGPLQGVHPLVAPTLHAYMQVREDLAYWTAGLSDAQVWSQPYGLAPVGFQLKHIAGSVERLTTYLRGEQLTTEQLKAAGSEMQPEPGRAELLEMVYRSLQRSEEVIRALDFSILTAARAVGRKHLPTTVAGLVVHLAEHTQRHVGELIVTAKLARPG